MNSVLRHLLLSLSCLLLTTAAISAPSTTQSSDPNAAYTAPPLPATNPIHWQPSSTEPTITDPLTAADFDTRSTALLSQSGPPTDPPDDSSPNLSVVVTTVTPKSPAEKLAIQPGDLLTSLGNTPLQYRWQYFENRDDTNDQSLTILPPDGKSRTVTIHPGRIGIELATRWDAESAWLRSKFRLTRFDRLMRIAALAHGSDPPLAWSALAKLQTQGCDGTTGGYVAPAIACLLCYQDLRFDDAITFGRIAMQHMPPDEKLLFAERIYKSALANFRLDIAAEELKSHKELPESKDILKAVNHSIDRFDATNETPTPQSPTLQGGDPSTTPDSLKHAIPNPLSELAKFPFQDATTHPTCAENHKDDRAFDCSASAKELARTGQLQLSAEDGHYQLLLLGPTAPDCDATLEFSFTPTRVTQSDFLQTFNFGLAYANQPANSFAVKAYIDTDNQITIQRNTADDYDLTLPPPPDGHWRVRMIILGQRCEFIVNGRRIYYGPIDTRPSRRQLGLLIQVVGINATIYHHTWRILPKPQ